ncbi:MAG: transcription elongation factor GreA [bacterium]|nr:transcription elongation factor GreA [bacterium]
MEHFVTQEGLEKLKNELRELVKKRQEIARMIEEAKQLGDLSENASYTEALDSQSFNEGKIAEVEELIRNASIISKQFTETVELGATIEVEGDNGVKTFTIVGSQESEPAKGRISNESPAGKAFLGHHKNDTVEVKTPKGMVTYKILSIR